MDEFPQCVICSNRFKYKGPKPKLLPCLHAACENCISHTQSIDCCQKTADIQNAALPTDSVRLAKIFQLTAKFNPSEFLCTHREDGNQAVSWCQECEEFFCEYCQNLHDEFKLTRKHKMKGIGDLSVLGQMKDLSSETYCRKHDMAWVAYDKACHCLVCYKCLDSDHVNHDKMTTDEYLKTCHEELDACLDKVTLKQNVLSDRLTSSYKLSCAMEERTKTLRENIQHAFQEIRTAVDQREKIVLAELDGILEHQLNINVTRQAFLKSVERNVSKAHDYISVARQMFTASDLLGLMNCVKNTTDDYVDVNLPGIQKKEGSLTFSKEGLEELKKSVAMFGCMCTKLNNSAIAQLSGEAGRHDTVKQQLEQLKKEIKDTETKYRREGERAKLLKDELLGFQKMVTELGLTLHCLSESESDRAKWLYGTKLTYDEDNVNREKTHINEDGNLVNEPCHQTYVYSSKAFKKYCGTSSTVPLPLTSCIQYWETVSQIQVKKPFTDYLIILEVGVCTTEDRDKMYYIGNKSISFAVIVVHCLRDSSICREIRQNGKRVRCLPGTFPNTVGSTCSVHMGVVFDATQARAAVVDVGEDLVMSRFNNLDTSKPLWPMFGVYNEPHCEVTMKLLVGNNITLTSEKKDLIRKALM